MKSNHVKSQGCSDNQEPRGSNSQPPRLSNRPQTPGVHARQGTTPATEAIQQTTDPRGPRLPRNKLQPPRLSNRVQTPGVHVCHGTNTIQPPRLSNRLQTPGVHVRHGTSTIQPPRLSRHPRPQGEGLCSSKEPMHTPIGPLLQKILRPSSHTTDHDMH